MSKLVTIGKYKYKVISIDASFNEKQQMELIAFLNLFSKSDIFAEFDNSKINIFLRQINLKEFEEKSQNFPEIKEITDKILQRILSIRSYGVRGSKRIYVDYDKERKVRARKEKEKERGKYFYALSHNFNDKNNSLPPEFENQIICGDSEEVLKNFPDNCVDLIFTSPPYNFGLEYENHKDAESWDRYLNKLFAIFDECIRVLKFGGRIIVNIQPLFSDYIPLHHIISNFFISRKLIWKGEIIWDKHNYNCKYTAWGSWKSPSNPYLKYTWEFLEIFSKGSLTHKGETDETDLTSEEFKKWVYAKWDIAPERNMKRWGHPAMFPEELARRVIKLFSFKGDIVLDPFNGVGTTTKVAKELGKKICWN